MASNVIFRNFARRSRRDVWEQFMQDEELHREHNITEHEMDLLKTFAPLGTLTSTDDIMFVLNKLRFARRYH
jgi:hypothetical protein